MKFATTATVIAAALAMFNPAEASLRGRRMDTDDQVGGLAGAMMSPAAFGIAKWGQRVGPFVGPMKSAMGFDLDDEFGLPEHTSGTLELKTLKLEEAELKLKLLKAKDDLKEAKDDVREEKMELHEKMQKLQKVARVYKLKESRLAKAKALIMHKNVDDEFGMGTLKLEEAKDDLKNAEYALKQAKDDAREEKEEWHQKMQEFKRKERVYKLKMLRLAKVKALIMQKGERVEISAYDEDGEDKVGAGWVRGVAGGILGEFISQPLPARPMDSRGRPIYDEDGEDKVGFGPGGFGPGGIGQWRL